MKKVVLAVSILLLSACSSNQEPSNTSAEEFMQQYAYVKKHCERMVAARNTYYTCEDSNNNMLLQPSYLGKSSPNNMLNNSVMRASWGPYVYWMQAPYQVW